MRPLYANRRADGVCPRCGADREDPTLLHCRPCRLQAAMCHHKTAERIERAKEAMRDRTLTGLLEAMIRGGKCYVSEYDI